MAQPIDSELCKESNRRYAAGQWTKGKPPKDGSVYLCEYTPSDGYNTGTPANATGQTLTYSAGSSAAISCGATKVAIYAGFGLIAVSVIVLAAFLLISLFSGNFGGTEAITAVVIGSIAVGVILMIGYYLIDVVAVSVCAAAV